MAQFGADPKLAAQCPVVPVPDGYRYWVDGDGPVPDALAQRAAGLAADQTVPLGTTESYPLPGVTTLLRVEPHVWSRDAQGTLVQGCFRATGIYLPTGTPSAASIADPNAGLNKMIAILTVASLAVGTIATLASWKK